MTSQFALHLNIRHHQERNLLTSPSAIRTTSPWTPVNRQPILQQCLHHACRHHPACPSLFCWIRTRIAVCLWRTNAPHAAEDTPTPRSCANTNGCIMHENDHTAVCNAMRVLARKATLTNTSKHVIRRQESMRAPNASLASLSKTASLDILPWFIATSDRLSARHQHATKLSSNELMQKSTFHRFMRRSDHASASVARRSARSITWKCTRRPSMATRCSYSPRATRDFLLSPRHTILGISYKLTQAIIW